MTNNIIDKQLNRMKELMGNSMISEAQKKAQDPVEFSTMGPDGNYYGIVREGAKYYIKSAKPNEKGELIKEHLDYIGGFLERRQNEYSSFASAKRNLEGKLGSLNEAIKANATLIECNTDKTKSKHIIIEAKGDIRADIKRQLEIMNNSQVLDESRAGYRSANMLVENEEKATPFTVSDKDGEVFDEKGLPKFKSTGEYKDKVYKGGETIIGKFNEAEDEEEVLGDDNEPIEDEAEMSLGDGVEDEDLADLGDDSAEDAGSDTVLAPEDEEGSLEDGDLDNDSSLDDSEFEENQYTIYLDPEDLQSGEELNIQVKVGNADDTDEFEDDDLYGDDEEGDDLGGEDLGGDDLGGDDLGGEELGDDDLGGEDLGGEDDEEDIVKAESRRRKGALIRESRRARYNRIRKSMRRKALAEAVRRNRILREENYFGKHPKYLAKPFTTPRAHAEFKNTYDWNDESVDNEEQPFTDNQRYKYFSERPQHIENSLGLAEGRIRSKKARRRF